MWGLCGAQNGNIGHKPKKGRTQGSPLHFYFLIVHLNALAFYHLGYCAVGSDGVDTCGQVRDFYAVGIGGMGYLDAVDIVHTYGASGSREVEHVCHGVRVEGKCRLGGGFGYVGRGALMLAGSSDICIVGAVLYLPVLVDSVLFVGGKNGSVI